MGVGSWSYNSDKYTSSLPSEASVLLGEVDLM